MQRPIATSSMRIRSRSVRGGEKYLFLLPGLAVLFLLNVFPMLYSLAVSFQHYSLAAPQNRHSVGLQNFASNFANPSFQYAIVITLVFTATTVAAQLLAGVVVAVVLNRDDIVGRRGFSTVFLLPMAVSPLVVAILWRFMLNPNFGVLSYFIDRITGQKVDLLTHRLPATVSLLVTYTWAWTPFSTLFIYSALLGVDKDYGEAAQIDGASSLRIIWSIELPIIRNMIVLITLLQTITAFRMFTVPALLTNGGPGIATQTLSYLVWQQGLNYFNMGIASSMSWIMVVIASVFAFLFLRLSEYEV